jgi:hypothetical protein
MTSFLLRPPAGGGNFSDTRSSHPHDSSKHKDTTVGDEIGTPPDGGSNNGVSGDKMEAAVVIMMVGSIKDRLALAVAAAVID